MSTQDFGLNLALFPSPPSSLPSRPSSPTQQQHSNQNDKFMAIGTSTPAQSPPRPELALYFNSPTMLPQHKIPIPLMPSNIDVVMTDAKALGPEPPRKRERSPLSSLDSEKGNKRKAPRKMRSSPFLAAGHFFHSLSSSASSPSPAGVAASGTSPKADGATGVRNGDTVTSPTTTTNASDNDAEMDTVKVISKAVRQRVAQSSSALAAASAIAVDTAAPARTVQVECTSPISKALPPTPSPSSSKSPFKKRRRVVETKHEPSPLRNPPLLPSDVVTASSSRPTPSTLSSQDKKPVKKKPVVWEKRPLVQKVLLKEFERTPHGAEILRRGAVSGIAFLEEQRHLIRSAEQNKLSGKSSRRSSDEGDIEVVAAVKSRSKEVSQMRHWGRIVKTALAGPLKEMAGPMAGDGRPPTPMIRAW